MDKGDGDSRCIAPVVGIHLGYGSLPGRSVQPRASRLVPMSEKIWYLKRCDLFEQLTAEDRQQLESHAVMRTFRRQEMIYFPSDPGETVIVVLRGKVKIKVL